MSTDTQPETTGRTFHPSDYRRAAHVIQSMRHVRGDRYTAKGEVSQAKVNALAILFASAFQGDAEGTDGAPFSVDYFMSGTQLPERPAYQVDDETDDEDANEDASEDANADTL